MQRFDDLALDTGTETKRYHDDAAPTIHLVELLDADKAKHIHIRPRVQREHLVICMRPDNVEYHARNLRLDLWQDILHEPQEAILVRRVREATDKQEILLLRIILIEDGRRIVYKGGDGLHMDGRILLMHDLRLYLGREVAHVGLAHHGVLDAMPVLGLLTGLFVMVDRILAHQTEGVKVGSMVDDLHIRMVADVIDVACRDVRTAEIGDPDEGAVPLDPAPDVRLELRTIEHLDAELLERGGVRLLMGEVVAEELHAPALTQEELHILIVQLTAGILIPGRYIVVDHQHAWPVLTTLTGVKRVRVAIIDTLLPKLGRPLLAELLLVHDLIMLQARGIRGVRAVRDALEVDDDGLRLEHNLLSVLPHLEGKVGILIVRRREALIEAADLLPELGTDHDRGT